MEKFETHLSSSSRRTGGAKPVLSSSSAPGSPHAVRRPTDPTHGYPDFLEWSAKIARYAATPASFEAFERMWFDDRHPPRPPDDLRAHGRLLLGRSTLRTKPSARAQAGFIPGSDVPFR